MARCSCTCAMQWPASCRRACWSQSRQLWCGRSASTCITGPQQVGELQGLLGGPGFEWPQLAARVRPYVACLPLSALLLLRAAGIKAVYGCNGAVWVGSDSAGDISPSQVQAAVQVADAVRAAAAAGAMLVPASIEAQLEGAA